MSRHIAWNRRAILAAGLVLPAAAGCATSGSAEDAGGRGRIRNAITQRRQPPTETTPSSGDLSSSDPRTGRGGFQVETVESVWTDESRSNRAIPWRAYLPTGAAAPVPVALYSHGGGGTRASGAQYGEHLASHGIASIHLQHAGSDRDAFRSDPQQISAAARDPRLGAPRFLDVGFVYRRLARDPGELGRRVDPARCGVYGHSFGAITTQIIAGQFVVGFDQSLAVPGIKGAVALSPSPPRDGYGDAATAFRSMLTPLYSLTGTEDDAPNGDFKAPARRIPFDRISNVDQVLTILNGANHFTFGGDPQPQLRGQSFAYPGLDRHHAIIRAATLAFFRFTLNGQTSERNYLESGPFRQLLSPQDTHETKRSG
jgi:predicted dienelactone hydrolase